MQKLLEEASIFCVFATKCMFLHKHVRLDINPAITFLLSRVKESTKNNWEKLLKVVSYLKGTRDDAMTLEADNDQVLT